MICPKCLKFYFKHAYFDKHIRSNNCIKMPPSSTKDNQVVLKVEKNDKEEKINLDLLKIETDNIITKNVNDIFLKYSNSNFENNITIQEIKKNILLLNQEILNLKQRISILEKNEPPQEIITPVTNTTEIPSNIKIIKKEKINMPDIIIKEHLNNKSLDSDCDLLYKIYIKNIPEDLIPIKKDKKKNEIIFWNGIDWQPDSNILKNIFSYNLKKLYTKVNIVIDNNPDNNYLNNQEHINNLTKNKKYQQDLFEYFIEKYCA